MKSLAGNPITDPMSRLPYPGVSIQDAHYVSDIRAVQEQPCWSGVWKSHALAVSATGKVIYVFRSPADVLASYLYLHRLQKYAGWDTATGRDVLDCYLDEMIKHWQTAVKIRENTPDRIFITSYESLHREPALSIQRMVSFLKTSALSVERCEQIVTECQFEKMAKAEGKSPNEERFFRRGRPGGGKETFTLLQRGYIYLRTHSLHNKFKEFANP